MVDKVKVEFNLDPKLIKQIEIISNAFNMSMKQFIEMNIEKDLNFILGYANEEGLCEVEAYYGIPFVNKEIFTKLLEA